MKLLSKLTLFNTLSKLAIVILFVLLLPFLLDKIAYGYTNYYLEKQKQKVLNTINRNGIDYYLEGETSYGSYTMLKEEYISLEPAGNDPVRDTIQTSRRIVEGDTLTYRILNHTFPYERNNYILEIGKTTGSIGQYNKPLQQVALLVLGGLILLTLVIDLIFTNILLRPLKRIIQTRLKNSRFPFTGNASPIKTSTTDFRYLDQSLIELMNRIHEDFQKEREFTSNASHELLTPISILQNKAENLLLDHDLSGEMQMKLYDIMKTLSRLRKIVQSLLFISRIENEQFAKSESFSLKEILTEIAEELEPRMEGRNINYSDTTEKLIQIQHANRDLIFQLLYNLINNAIRYNKDGGSIRISGYFREDNSYVLHIEDTGIGMTQDQIPLIFNRFKKSTSGGSESYGLGLSIVKSIIQYHDMKINVSSEIDKGTLFELEFPQHMVRLLTEHEYNHIRKNIFPGNLRVERS